MCHNFKLIQGLYIAIKSNSKQNLSKISFKTELIYCSKLTYEKNIFRNKIYKRKHFKTQPTNRFMENVKLTINKINSIPVYMFFSLIVVLSKFIGIIDGGSTGTRLNIFEFEARNLKSHFLLPSKPGLHTLDLKDVNHKMKDLLLKGIDYLNSKNVDYENMFIGFYGTGGLRTLDARKSWKILKAVKDVLENFGFETEVELLKDTDEAYFALKTLDYLTDEKNKTHGKNGIIEMGGSSVQVAFKSKRGKFNIKDQNVCLLSYPNKGYIVRSFNNDVLPIKEINDLNLYLVAFFYDVLKDLGDNCLNINKIEKAMWNKCIEKYNEECRGLAYIKNFLRSLGIRDDKNFRIANEINGTNINWALGKALEKLDI